MSQQQLMKPFNPSEWDPELTGGLPIGRHPVVITAGEIKPTKENDGGLLEFTLTAIDGPAKGASQKYRLNLYNKSQQSVEIANRQLSALCHVTGVFQLGADGCQFMALANIPFQVEIAKQKNDERYTEVSGVFDIQGNPPKKAGTGGAAPQTTQQNQGGNGGGWNNGGNQQQPQQSQGAQGGGWGNQGGQTQQQGGQGGGWGNGGPGTGNGGQGGQQPNQGGGGAPQGGAWGGGRPG